MLLADDHNSRENDYDYNNVLMRYIQLPN